MRILCFLDFTTSVACMCEGCATYGNGALVAGKTVKRELRAQVPHANDTVVSYVCQVSAASAHAKEHRYFRHSPPDAR